MTDDRVAVTESRLAVTDDRLAVTDDRLAVTESRSQPICSRFAVFSVLAARPRARTRSPVRGVLGRGGGNRAPGLGRPTEPGA